MGGSFKVFPHSIDSYRFKYATELLAKLSGGPTSRGTGEPNFWIIEGIGHTEICYAAMSINYEWTVAVISEICRQFKIEHVIHTGHAGLVSGNRFAATMRPFENYNYNYFQWYIRWLIILAEWGYNLFNPTSSRAYLRTLYEDSAKRMVERLVHETSILEDV